MQLERQSSISSLPSNEQALGKILLEAQQAQERLLGPGVLSDNQKFGVTQAFGAEVAGRGGSTMIDTQRSINDQKALAEASRKVPVKVVIVGIQGEILSEDWL